MFYFLSVPAIVVCTFVYMDFYMVELSRAEHSHSPTEAHFSCNIVLMHSALVLYHHLFCKPAMPHFSMVIPENNSCIWISRMPDLIINTISLHHHAVAAMSWSLRLVLHGSA